MYQVTQDFMDKMRAMERRTYGKVQIDYTDPFLDQSIVASVNEQAAVSYPSQTADSVSTPAHKWASLDGSWMLDGSYHLAPASEEEAATLQMGWWGAQLAGAGGAFAEPFPTLTVTHTPRPVHSLKAIGDSARGEWPVDFEIRLYAQDDTLLRTESVTGNTELTWSMTLPSPVLDVARQVLTITRWSHPGRQVKILEFFTSIQETYEGDDILQVRLLEEREISRGSLPVGNISANEIDIRLVNAGRKFDAGNTQSPLYQTIKANRRIKAWLGVDAENIESPNAGTFTRSSTAYNPETGAEVAPNVPRYVAGAFGDPGGAIVVEERTENKNSDPFFAAGVAGWYKGSYQVMEHLAEQANPWSHGLGVMRLYDNDGLKGYAEKAFSGLAHDIHTVSALVAVLKGDVANLTVGGAFLYTDATYTDYTLNLENTKRVLQPSFGPNVYLLTATVTPETGKTIDFYRLRLAHTDVGESELHVYGVALEQKPYATTLHDGTRSPEALTIPTAGVLSPQEGAWEQWVYVNDVARRRVAGQYPGIFHIPRAGGGNGILVFHLPVSANWRLATYDDANEWSGVDVSDSYTPDGWHLFRVTWTNQKAVLRIDGVERGVINNPNLPSAFYANAHVGTSGTSYHLNTAHADIRISSIARTDDSDLASYQSGQPLSVDQWTTYKLTFNGSIYPVERCWVPLGMFWSGDWSAPEDEVQASTTGRDRLESLRKGSYSTSQVAANTNLYNLAVAILQDAGLASAEYWVDTELQQYSIPYAWFETQSHREALRKVAEVCLGQVYCGRDGVVRVEGPSFLASKTVSDLTLTSDDYFRKDNPAKWSQIANYIEVETAPLRPDVLQEVYRSNEPVPIAAGETKVLTVFFNEVPCIDSVASLEGEPAGCSIIDVTYYAWGAQATVYNSTTAGSFTLVITARPLRVLNKERAIAQDQASITDNGKIKFTFPENPLLQTLSMAQAIADTLLASFRNARRDAELEWRGNPALLLGDRVTVVDRNEQNDYFVTRQEIEWDGALRAKLSGRRAS